METRRTRSNSKNQLQDIEKENSSTPLIKRKITETSSEETPVQKPKTELTVTPLRTPKTPNQTKPTPNKRTPKMSPREEKDWKKKADEEIEKMKQMFDEVDQEKLKVQRVGPYI